MNKLESAITWMERLASDNSHGYSQANRWGPDYDCSSAVITAFEQAGIPVKTYGATYTGNMEPAFLRAGFRVVTNNVNLVTGDGLVRGDVLLNIASHTALYLGNKRVVHARSSEGNYQTGDQSGNEIREQAYWNYPWDCVLRYPSEETVIGSISSTSSIEPDGIARPDTWKALIKDLPLVSIKTGEKFSWATTALQSLLNYYGADLDADGEFGPLTLEALIAFQKSH